MQKLLTALIALTLLPAAVAGCGEGAKERSSQGIGQQGGSPSGGGGGGGGGTLRVALPTGQTSFANVDVVVADKKGFFAKQGVKVSTQNFGSGLKSVQAVIAGGTDIGASSIEPVAAAAARNQDVKVITPYADRLTVNVTTPGSIRGVADLKGKPVGIQDVGAFREIMVRYVLSRSGMTDDDVKYRPVAANGYVNALVAGQIDAAVLQPEQYYTVKEHKPDFHSVADLYRLQPNYFYGTYFVSGKWLKSHREEATAFATALMEAHRFMYRNKAETVKIAAEATGVDAKSASRAYDVLLAENKVFPVDAGLDQSRITYTLGQLEKLKTLSGEAPSYGDFVDAGPGQAAERKLGPAPERGTAGGT
jgi:ABC-type nitrate/sulfonate/bicarbonate transport system substrate-binding protein